MSAPDPAHPTDTAADRQTPLFVDLDGTLIATDTLLVNFRLVLSRKPLAVIPMLGHLAAGRASLKDFLATTASIQPDRLPYRPAVLEFLTRHREHGRPLILATAAHHRIANAVAQHLQLFDSVIASDRHTNQKSSTKLAAILGHTRDTPFDYIGDSRADLPIFRAARQAHLVCPSPRLLREAQATCRVGRIFR